MDAVAWSAWTANGIAIVGIGYTWWANRITKRDAAVAQEQAQQSLAVAKEAATAQRRMADALEKMLEKQDRHTAESAVGQRDSAVGWQVSSADGDGYVLTNVGSAPAYDVHLTASPAVRFTPPRRPAGDRWGPGESAEFAAVGSWQTGTPTLVVTWRAREGGEQYRWERVIPR